MSARPFVKWAGGKRALLDQLLPRLPERFARYHEPFVGGGALFFALKPQQAWVSDVNPDLIQLYQAVQQDAEALIEELATYPFEREFYTRIRALDPDQLDPVRRAARMLYLNRTCFNGLYRVNKKGQFNVPMGRYRNPTICDAEGLLLARDALKGHEIQLCSFEQAATRMQPGDLAYMDPPYQPLSVTANFTAYTRLGFGEAEQRRLARLFTELGQRGVQCILSNSDTPLIRELYAEHRIERVQAPRSISRNSAGRAPVGELIIRNF